jgi:uncharacterized membrane protein
VEVPTALQKGISGIRRTALQRVGILGVPLRDLASAERSITIGRDPAEVEALFRDPERLSRVFGHFAQLRPGPDGRTHWRVHGRDDAWLEWDAEPVDDRPGERLAWRSVPGAAVASDGEVRLRPAHAGLGTVATLRLRVEPPADASGTERLAPLPIPVGAVVLKALHRAKSLLETGEVPTLEGSPSARGNAAATTA